ncbi:MAG: hypothetical protein JNL32_15995, partial [Candidatus Kapabacteria bacterium]|nr:hypothetical protein [Candidatus Kapabacteria bacterium]
MTRHPNIIALLLAVFIAAALGITAVAQEPITEPVAEEAPPAVLRIGASVGMAAGINTADIPTGWKTGLAMPSLPALGITGMMAVMHSIGLDAMIDIGISSTAFQSRPFFQPTDSNMITMQATYLSIAPSVAYRYGFLGLGVGIPVASHISTFDGTRTYSSVPIPDGAPITAGNTVVPIRSLASVLLDLRFGGNLPLVTDGRGTLMLYGVASYQLNRMFANVQAVQQLTYQGAL